LTMGRHSCDCEQPFFSSYSYITTFSYILIFG
jgi:hypothetical protein